jgi:hypothetical protein
VRVRAIRRGGPPIRSTAALLHCDRITYFYVRNFGTFSDPYCWGSLKARRLIMATGNRAVAPTELNKKGLMALGFPAAWVKSPSFTAGQCPVMRYNRDLMMAIL